LPEGADYSSLDNATINNCAYQQHKSETAAIAGDKKANHLESRFISYRQKNAFSASLAVVILEKTKMHSFSN